MVRKRRVLVVYGNEGTRCQRFAVSINQNATIADLARDIAATLKENEDILSLRISGDFELRAQDGVSTIHDGEIVTVVRSDHAASSTDRHPSGVDPSMGVRPSSETIGEHVARNRSQSERDRKQEIKGGKVKMDSTCEGSNTMHGKGEKESKEKCSACIKNNVACHGLQGRRCNQCKKKKKRCSNVVSNSKPTSRSKKESSCKAPTPRPETARSHTWRGRVFPRSPLVSDSEVAEGELHDSRKRDLKNGKRMNPDSDGEKEFSSEKKPRISAAVGRASAKTDEIKRLELEALQRFRRLHDKSFD